MKSINYNQAIEIADMYNINKIQYKINELNEAIAEIKDRIKSGSVMICSHNTILALKYNDKVSHIVTMDGKRNIIGISELDEHLAVPRFEPKTAKDWMNEELELTNRFDILEEEHEDMYSCYSKTTLSERELRELVLQDKENDLEMTINQIKVASLINEVVTPILKKKIKDSIELSDKEQRFIESNKELFYAV